MSVISTRLFELKTYTCTVKRFMPGAF